MCNSYGTSICKYLQRWENLTKNDISLRWLKWGAFDTSKLIFLYAQLETACSKVELNDWEAYLGWKLEASNQAWGGGLDTHSPNEATKGLLDKGEECVLIVENRVTLRRIVENRHGI